MTQFKSILTLLMAVQLHGLKMPGACPTVPKTGDIRDLCAGNSHLATKLGIPFEEDHHPSYVFNKYSIATQPDMNIQCNKTLMFWKTTRYDMILTTNLTMDQERENIYLTTSVHLKGPSPCSITTTKDTVIMWFNNYSLIIWSCVDLEGGDHDEALLFLFRGEKTTNNCDFYSEEAINNTLWTYLQGPLLQTIDWRQKYSPRPFECDLVVSDKSETTIILVALIAAVLLLLCLAEFGHGRIKRRSTRVGPS